MRLKKIRVQFVAMFIISAAFLYAYSDVLADPIIHDAEYYILEAQHEEKWKAEDKIVGAEIWLETIRPIAANEQLTIDYAWPASGAILCECESDNCRGWIVAEEELDQLPLVVEGGEGEGAADRRLCLRLRV